MDESNADRAAALAAFIDEMVIPPDTKADMKMRKAGKKKAHTVEVNGREVFVAYRTLKNRRKGSP